MAFVDCLGKRFLYIQCNENENAGLVIRNCNFLSKEHILLFLYRRQSNVLFFVFQMFSKFDIECFSQNRANCFLISLMKLHGLALML